MQEPVNTTTVTFQARRGLLRAHVTGVKGTLDVTLGYWRRIAEEVRRRKPRNVLVVDEMEGEPLAADQFQKFIGAMRDQGFEGLRVAFVVARGEHVPHVEGAEILARAVGFNARVFGNENDAALWLRHGED